VRARRARLAALALAAFFATLLPGAARAQEDESSRFSWRPSLQLTTVADDNVFYEDGGVEGSVGFWVVPRLELDYRTPGVQLGADLSADVRRYVDQNDELAAELYRAVGWAEVGLSPGLTLRVSNAFVPQPLRIGRPEDEGSNLVQTNRSDGELRWWLPAGGAGEIELGVVGTWFWTEDYDELLPADAGGFILEEDFRASYTQALGFAQYRRELGERTSMYARGRFSYRAFADLDEDDLTQLGLVLGMRTQRWTNLDFELAGGVGGVGFDGFFDALRALGRLRARYRAEGGWSFALGFDQLLTPNAAGDDALESTGELTVEKRFGLATAASLRVFLTRLDADLPGVGADLFGGVELRVRRQLTRHLQLALAYRHWRNRGDFDLDDFSQNRVALEVGWRL
jgi:hypothetical protein